MKKFKTITEYDLVYAAYYDILTRWHHEMDLRVQAESIGATDEIATIKENRYWKQLKELEQYLMKSAYIEG